MRVFLLIAVLILVYTVWSEIRSQDCRGSCENQAPVPAPGATPEEILAEIRDGTRVLYNSVDWRKSMFVAIVAWLGLYALYKEARNVEGIYVAVGLLSVFLGTYLAFTWIQERYWKPLSQNIYSASQFLVP